MKKTVCMILVVVLAFSMAACSAGPAVSSAVPAASGAPTSSAASAPSGGSVIVHKLGHVQTVDHPYHAGATRFKELVEERSNGQIRIDLFPSSQLGGTREQMEGLQLNTLQYSIQSVAQAGNYNPRFKVFTLPYIFRDEEHAFKVADGEIGQQLAGELEESKMKIMGYWANGWRHITNNLRPIKTVEDVHGMKLRSQEAPIFVEFVKAIGAVPSVIPFGELYTALEQKVVDGQENPFAQVANNKFYEVQKYLSLTAHTFDVATLLMSTDAFNSLTPELRAIVEESAADATVYQREFAITEAATFLQEIKDNGMEVIEDVDLESFRQKAESVYYVIADEIGQDIIDAVQAVS